MKKVIITLILIVAIILAIILAMSGAPDDIERVELKDVKNTEKKVVNEDDVDYDLSKLDFEFIGFGPGKKHVGTFNNISLKGTDHNGDHFTKGTITFENESIETDTKAVTTHLCKEEFFNCEVYKESTFKLTNAERISDTEIKATGILTIKGVSKEISFPVTQSENTLSADFIIDTKPFGIDTSFADSEVQIKFSAEI